MSRDAFAELAAQIEADGYRRAVEDLRCEFNAVLDRLSLTIRPIAEPSKSAEAAALSELAQIPELPRRGRRPRANSSLVAVLALITQRPGLRGADLATRLSEAEQPIPERTVRTAINRLKATGKITKIGEGWHPAPVP